MPRKMDTNLISHTRKEIAWVKRQGCHHEGWLKFRRAPPWQEFIMGDPTQR